MTLAVLVDVLSEVHERDPSQALQTSATRWNVGVDVVGILVTRGST
jgi:hypothetical protein